MVHTSFFFKNFSASRRIKGAYSNTSLLHCQKEKEDHGASEIYKSVTFFRFISDINQASAIGIMEISEDQEGLTT